MNVLEMLWLNPILCRMMQSSAHVRLELVMNKVRKEESPGRQELILCPQCGKFTHGLKVWPSLMGHS